MVKVMCNIRYILGRNFVKKSRHLILPVRAFNSKSSLFCFSYLRPNIRYRGRIIYHIFLGDRLKKVFIASSNNSSPGSSRRGMIIARTTFAVIMSRFIIITAIVHFSGYSFFTQTVCSWPDIGIAVC